MSFHSQKVLLSFSFSTYREKDKSVVKNTFCTLHIQTYFMYKIHVYIYIFILYNHPYIQYIHKDCTHTLYTHSHPQHYLTSMISQHLYFCLVVEKEAEKCLWCTAKASKQGNKVTFKQQLGFAKLPTILQMCDHQIFEIRGFHIQTVSSIKSRTPQQTKENYKVKESIFLSHTKESVGIRDVAKCGKGEQVK